MALKDIPAQFNIDSEEEVRIAVFQFFKELGFDLDEVSAEDSFSIRLGHTSVTINGKKISDEITGRSDLLLMRNGIPLAIIETKHIDHGLTTDDASQAISYARLLRRIAPFAFVTNGRETRVYDVITTELIDSPEKSIWVKNGQRLVSIGDDLLYESAQLIIGITPSTLKNFCQQQVLNALEDLKGTSAQQRKYIPSLYVPRSRLDDLFNEWLSNDISFFPVIGESGYGKTNFLCFESEKLLRTDEYYVLFYSASRINGGVLQSIQNDFSWEFNREKGIAYIFQRLTELCHQVNKKLVIFIDGLDEFNGEIKYLKNELIDLDFRVG